MRNDEIIRVLREGRETRAVEFKRAMSWTDNATKSKVLQGAIALANTADGGVLVFGMARDTSPDIHVIAGLDATSAESFSTDHVADFVNAHATPHVALEVRHPTVDDQRLVVIVVRQFVESPSIVTKAYDPDGGSKGKGSVPRGAIYVRSLRKPETRRLEDPEDLRELVRVASLRELARYFNVRSLERAAGPEDAALFRGELREWES